MKKTTFLILIIICLIAALPRFYQLGRSPAGLYIDEASQGYNAYSILMTGKDEFDKSWPIVFRAFNDFRTPLYTYLITPLIPFLGLTPLAVRLPSAVIGTLTPLLLFFFVRYLLKSLTSTRSDMIALFSAFTLAVSPWHILFSRTAYETNLSLFLVLVGSLFFYKGLKQTIYLLPSSVFLALAIIAYQAERILVPALLLFWIFNFRKVLFSRDRLLITLSGFVAGLIIALPTLTVSLTPGFLARASGLNIFSPNHPPAGYFPNLSSPFSWLINNHLFLSIREFLSLYFSYFSPRNIFFLGDSGPRSSYPELATFFVWQTPLFLWGSYRLLKSPLLQLKPFVLFLLLVSPLPAALTRDPFSTIRSLPLVVPYSIIIGLALSDIISRLNNPLAALIGKTTLIILITYSFLKLHSSIIILNEHFRAKEWDYGWSQLVGHLSTLNPNLPIVVDNSRSEPYIELLFFLKFDPSKYQAANYDIPLEEYYTNLTRNTTKTIGKITTRPIKWQTDLQQSQYLIGDRLAISDQQITEHNLKLITTINYPNNSPAILVVKVEPK